MAVIPLYGIVSLFILYCGVFELVSGMATALDSACAHLQSLGLRA